MKKCTSSIIICVGFSCLILFFKSCTDDTEKQRVDVSVRDDKTWVGSISFFRNNFRLSIIGLNVATRFFARFHLFSCSIKYSNKTSPKGS